MGTDWATIHDLLHLWHDVRMPAGAKTPPGPFSQELAAILRAQMARKQLWQAQVAVAAGMSQGQLSAVLNGKKHIDMEQLDRLCYVLGLKLVEVLREADEASKWRLTEAGQPTPLVSD
jgi:DNA-binding Xre family transcriptional regulator